MLKRTIQQLFKTSAKVKSPCVLPWIGVQSDASGNVYPCCVIDRKSPSGNILQNSIFEIWNSEVMKKLRLQMLAGDKPEVCKTCNLKEERGAISYRQQAQNIYSDELSVFNETKPDGSVDTKHIKVLEIRPTNVCNFKCRTCEPLQSTLWYPEGKILGIEHDYKIYSTEEIQKNITAVTDQILPQLKKIHFSGGESLVQAEHYKFLESLIARGKTDLELTYNSNLSNLTFQNYDILKLWKNFKKVQLMISLDGWGEQGELIRKGFKTDLFEKNLQRVLKEATNMEIKFHITVSVINAFHITELIDILLSKGYLGVNKGQVPDFDFGLVENPEYYDIGILNLQEREELKKHYHQFLTNIKANQPQSIQKTMDKQFNSILNWFSKEVMTDERAKFKVATIKIDSLRNEKLIKLFPELMNLFLENKTV